MTDDQGAVPPAVEVIDDPAVSLADVKNEFDTDDGMPPSASTRSILPIILVGLAMLLLGIFLGYMGRGQFGPEAQAAHATATQEAIALATRSAQGQKMMEYLVKQNRHWRGPEDAKVVMIEFSDYQCPYCGQFAKTIANDIEKKYVETGKVRFGYWNFAFLGDESQWAGEAAECAGDQNKYWEYHHLLWDKQDGENKGAFSKANLKAFAGELGLNAGAFNECLDSGKYTSIVKTDTQLAQQIGVQSTPSFVVNGTPIVGAQPLESFEKLFQQFAAQEK